MPAGSEDRVSLELLILVMLAAASHGKSAHPVKDLVERSGDPSQALSSPTLSDTTSTSFSSSSMFPIQFLQPANATACHSLTLRWQSTNLTALLTLIVTNDHAAREARGGLGNDVLISRTIATNILPSADQVVWSPVDVPQGAYVVTAHDAARTQLGILSESPPFFVFVEDQPTCSFTTVDNTTSSKPSLPPTLQTSAAGSDASPAHSAVSGPQPKGMSSGGIGGMVAGIVVAVVLVLLAFGLLYYRRKKSVPRRPRNPRVGGLYYLF